MDLLKRVFRPHEGFQAARALAAQGKPRQIILVRPDLSLLAVDCPTPSAISPNVIRQMESIVSPSDKRNIAVISSTGSAPGSARAPVGSASWMFVAASIPFFGILNGLACIGHNVWLFDRSSDVQAGCRDADILIVDSEVTGSVSLDAARRVMRGSNVYIHDRATFQLRPAPSESPSAAGWPAVFQKARAATRQAHRFQIVLVQPDRSLLCLPCIPKPSMTADQLERAHRLIPEGAPRNVAVIAPTELERDPADTGASPGVARIRAAGRAIPFFGLLLNLASAGNPVWVFDGREDSAPFGCRDADLLFIDSRLAGTITAAALDRAAGQMRSGNIAVYDRDSRKMALLRHVGPTKEKLEFRD